VTGDLAWVPALDRPDLLAKPVTQVLLTWDAAPRVLVAQIDPDVADTADLVRVHRVPAGACANCVVVAGRRDGERRVAACLVLATTRVDVNTVVRAALDVRKASFMPVDAAVSGSGMEYGGITPVGLPTGWRLLVDAAVTGVPLAVIGSGVRRSKLALPGADLATLPSAEIVTGLARPAS
jgi:prolyl-tRNA editing enzyme YbaK/EbsC (Cys-tRNA(Pro) deacylase)